MVVIVVSSSGTYGYNNVFGYEDGMKKNEVNVIIRKHNIKPFKGVVSWFI